MTDVRFLFYGKNVTSFSSRSIFEPVLLPQIKELTELLAQKTKESHENYLDRVSKDADEYVSKIGSKIVLIDGSKLAELMIEFGVAVATEATYTMKRIDNDFFESI